MNWNGLGCTRCKKMERHRDARLLCTLSPEVCRWVLESADAEIASATANHLLTLDRMVNFLLPSEDAKLLAQRHRAGADAALAFQVFLVLLKRGTVKVG